MAKPQLGPILRQIDLLFNEGTVTGHSDAQLLERFATNRDEAAFEALVHRHGPMVLAVCRGVLKNPHDSQDAFQTAFLVLVRRARSLWVINGSLGSWLYRVAYRIAIKANADASRRRLIERQATKVENERADESPEEVLIPAMHEEINRLPEKYRAPIVLCHLERLTHAVAARQLNWTEGMVRGRVARGRELLRKRLTRRGLSLSGAGLVSLLTRQTASAAIPKMWIDTTIAAAVAVAAGRVSAVAFTTGIIRMLLLTRLSTGSALVVAIVLGSVAGLVGARWLAAEDDIDARGLAFASQMKPVVRPIPTAPPPMDQRPNIDPRYVPADGYDLYGWNQFDLSNVRSEGDSIRLRDRYGGGREPVIIGSGYLDEGENGDLIVTIGHSLEPNSLGVLGCRPVVFDEKGTRYLPLFERTIRSKISKDYGTAIDRFRLARNILPVDAMAAVSIERLKPEEFPLARLNTADPRVRIDEPTGKAPAALGFEPASNRSWTIVPRHVGGGDWSASKSGSDEAVACDVMKTGSGKLVVHISYVSQTRVRNLGGAVPEYRPAFFDARGHRCDSDVHWSDFTEHDTDIPADLSGMAHFRFEVPAAPNQPQRIDRSPAAQIAFIGVERLDSAAMTEAVIQQCLNQLQDREEFLERFEKLRRVEMDSEGTGDDPSALLGLIQVLTSDQGQRLKLLAPPRSLRSAHIAAFRKFMKMEEIRWGRHFAALTDQPSYFADQILLKHDGELAEKGDSKPPHEQRSDARLVPTSTLESKDVIRP